MNKSFIVFFTLFYSVSSCNKKQHEIVCDEYKQYAETEISRGNIFYYHSFNYSNVLEYELFKKYELIDYLIYFPVTNDSCFKNSMNTKIELIINKKIVDFHNEIERLKITEDSVAMRNNGNILKFKDSIYYPTGNLIDFPIMRSPMFKSDFKKYLVSTVIQKMDKNYESSSFWIVINTQGKVENIERYKKHSKKVDDFIEKELTRTVWTPALHKIDSVFVKSRICFQLNAIPYSCSDAP